MRLLSIAFPAIDSILKEHKSVRTWTALSLILNQSFHKLLVASGLADTVLAKPPFRTAARIRNSHPIDKNRPLRSPVLTRFYHSFPEKSRWPKADGKREMAQALASPGETASRHGQKRRWRLYSLNALLADAVPRTGGRPAFTS